MQALPRLIARSSEQQSVLDVTGCDRVPVPLSHHGSIPSENVSRVDLLLYIIQNVIIAVCYNGISALLELLYVIHHQASKEGAAVRQCRLIDDNRRALRLDPLHNALDAALAKVLISSSLSINSYELKCDHLVLKCTP